MRKSILGIFVFALAVSMMSGCAAQEKLVPVHDEVLIYDLPFDLTYLRTLEALERVPDWELELTEKEKGFVTVRNVNFSRFDDADERLVKVLVKRVGRNQTSVRLAPESQRVLGGEKLLAAVSKHMSREISS